MSANMVSYSDIIKSTKEGDKGSIGKTLKSLSIHIPVIGYGVSFLGSLLNYID